MAIQEDYHITAKIVLNLYFLTTNNVKKIQ